MPRFSLRALFAAILIVAAALGLIHYFGLYLACWIALFAAGMASFLTICVAPIDKDGSLSQCGSVASLYVILNSANTFFVICRIYPLSDVMDAIWLFTWWGPLGLSVVLVYHLVRTRAPVILWLLLLIVVFAVFLLNFHTLLLASAAV